MVLYSLGFCHSDFVLVVVCSSWWYAIIIYIYTVDFKIWSKNKAHWFRTRHAESKCVMYFLFILFLSSMFTFSWNHCCYCPTTPRSLDSHVPQQVIWWSPPNSPPPSPRSDHVAVELLPLLPCRQSFLGETIHCSCDGVISAAIMQILAKAKRFCEISHYCRSFSSLQVLHTPKNNMSSFSCITVTIANIERINWNKPLNMKY